MLVLKQVTVVDNSSSWHGKKVNISIANGTITDIKQADSLNEHDTSPENVKNMCVSAGWVDLRARSGEPGNEHRETLDTLCRAAARGGFTKVGILPETNPPLQSKAAISFFTGYHHNTGVQLLPIAAITQDLKGEKLNDLLDLHYNHATAFSDGAQGIQNADIMLKALQYLKPTGKKIFQRPLVSELSAFALMHEGLASTRLGIKGFPQMSEYIQVQRDLHLLEYTGGNLHISGISTVRSMELIAEAKSKGLNVTCDVAAHQLCFTDDALEDFDQNYKVNPPLRTEATRKGLIQGVINGVIDAITSDHTPLEPELKQIEFDKAEFGIAGIETVYAAVQTYAPEIPLEILIDRLSHRPAKILGISLPPLEIGNSLPLTLFAPDETFTEQQEYRQSKSANSPFTGKKLKGKVIGIYTPGHELYYV